MKNSLKWMIVCVVVLSLFGTYLYAGGKKETATGEKEVMEPVTVSVVFHEGELPGLANWMDKAATIYMENNPGIVIENRLTSQDTLYSDFQAAAAAKDPDVGPDLMFVWDGIWTLEFAWEGNLAPFNDYISEEELSNMLGVTRSWDDKVWGVGYYPASPVMIYNKEYFKKAGLDPDNPPRTWAEFEDACAKIKKTGITPIGFGTKDQWANGWLISFYGYPLLDSMEDMLRLVSDGTFLQEEWFDIMRKVDNLRKKGYFNEDVSSLDFYPSWDLVPQGEVAMAITVESLIPAWAEVMGAENVGIFPHAPIIGDGKLGGKFTTQVQGFAMSSWSPNKQEAADYLKFLHTPDMLTSFYEDTGALPADTRFDRSLITLEPQKIIYDGILTGEPFALWMECYFPAQLDFEGWYPAIQQMWIDELGPDDVIYYVQDTLEKWREQNPQQVAIYRKWQLKQGF
jgi:multiple sugar transport system substrate-binding protein